MTPPSLEVREAQDHQQRNGAQQYHHLAVPLKLKANKEQNKTAGCSLSLSNQGDKRRTKSHVATPPTGKVLGQLQQNPRRSKASGPLKRKIWNKGAEVP